MRLAFRKVESALPSHPVANLPCQALLIVRGEQAQRASSGLKARSPLPFGATERQVLLNVVETLGFTSKTIAVGALRTIAKKTRENECTPCVEQVLRCPALAQIMSSGIFAKSLKAADAQGPALSFVKLCNMCEKVVQTIDERGSKAALSGTTAVPDDVYALVVDRVCKQESDRIAELEAREAKKKAKEVRTHALPLSLA